MKKKIDYQKHGYFAVLCLAFVFCITLVFLGMEQDKKTDQYEDIKARIEKLNWGESFSVSELTHYLSMKEIENTLKKMDKSGLTEPTILIGELKYKFVSVGYNTENKFCYRLVFGTNSSNSSSWMEISFEDEKINDGMSATKKIMTIKLIQN